MVLAWADMPDRAAFLYLLAALPVDIRGHMIIIITHHHLIVSKAGTEACISATVQLYEQGDPCLHVDTFIAH